MNPIKFKYETFDHNGEEMTVELPGRMVVCEHCAGTGVHDSPSFGDGIPERDFDEDPDFRADYFAGKYDVVCTTCHGEKVVVGVDLDECSIHQLFRWQEYLRERRTWAEQSDMECRMGY